MLLSGAGGDDLFTGYRRHRAWMAEQYWDWLPGSVRGGLTQIAEAVGRLINDPGLRQHLAQKGFIRAETFSWHKCANNTFNLLSSVAKSSFKS